MGPVAQGAGESPEAITTEQRVIESSDAFLMEPLQAVSTLEHLLVPVPALAAVAIGLCRVPLVRLVPFQRVPVVIELPPRLLHMCGELHLLLPDCLDLCKLG